MWDRRNLPGNETAWKSTWGIDDRVTARAFLDLLAKEQKRPYFAVLHTVSGHHPFHALPEHEKEPLSRYPAYVRAVGVADQVIATVLNELQARGALADTLVLIVSDHGEGIPPHGGRNAYEGSARVPAVLFGPQTRSISEPVRIVTSHLDLAPTLLALLGVKVPCSMKGRNLLAPAQQRLALFGTRPPETQYGLIDGKYKYILDDFTWNLLFDLDTDPNEQNNLAKQFPDLVEAFRTRIVDQHERAINISERYVDHLKLACPE
jgi:arylsulfatase A-like enzyme